MCEDADSQEPFHGTVLYDQVNGQAAGATVKVRHKQPNLKWKKVPDAM